MKIDLDSQGHIVVATETEIEMFALTESLKSGEQKIQFKLEYKSGSRTGMSGIVKIEKGL